MVIIIRIEKVKGRKATATGRVEDLNGTVLVEASSTFVQPRYAKLLQSEELRKAMGEPPSSSRQRGPALLAEAESRPTDSLLPRPPS